MANLRERKKANTREAILDAAALLLSEKGYDVTTVDEIADMALVSKVTFYSYFKAKEDLIEALKLRILEKVFERPRALIDAGMSLQDVLYAMADDQLGWIVENSDLFVVLLNQKLRASSWNDVHQEHPTLGMLTELFRQRQKFGELKAFVHPEMLTQYVMLLLRAEQVAWIQSNKSFDLSSRMRQAIDLLMEGAAEKSQ